MSLYLERLSKLQKEISIIKQKKRKKKFKKDQQIMVDFINGVNSSAEFEVDSKKIILRTGDEKKGFRHILERHYCKGCDGEITTIEILNIIDVVRRGIKLENVGVTNDSLIVYYRSDTEHKLVLKPMENEELVVTMYSNS